MNPYYSYAISFTLSLIVYQLNWSGYFPELNISLFIFLILTITAAVLIGKWHNTKWKIDYCAIPKPNGLKLATSIFYLLWTMEFIHAGGIPILMIILGTSYDYRTFGMPTLHVAIVTCSSFFTTYLFHIYLSKKNKSVLFLYFINLLAAILIMNRGMLFLNICSSIFIYIFSSTTGFRLSNLLKIGLASFTIILLFGVLGHLRVSHALNQLYDRTIIYEIAEANDTFKSNSIPSEFLWTYLYIAQPIATLQHNITLSNPNDKINIINLLQFINSEWVPDFISKRIFHSFNSSRQDPLLIANHLNASTVYSRSYFLLGWLGLLLMFIFILCFAIIYFKLLLKSSRYYVTGAATICTLYTFLIFDNFFVFSGFSLQLVYPFAMEWINNNITQPQKLAL